MPTEIELHCDIIEECYEFTLSYAARGLSSGQESDAGKQIRYHLTRAAEAIASLKASCAAALGPSIAQQQLAPREKYEAFFEVLARDAQSAIAAIELVLAQPVISSQLIDNLNANIHLRALLTDLFLVTEILQLHQAQSSAMAETGSETETGIEI